MRNFNIVEKWKKALFEAISNDKKTKAKNLVDNLMFFFSFKGEPYGASENSRVTYAKMKDDNDEDNTKSWRKEANFSAANLKKCLDGEETQTIFSIKDLDDIKVINKEKALKLLGDK